LIFPKNFVNALNNPQLRRNLRAAMDTLGMRRRAIFSDKDAFEALRAQGDAIRQRSLRKLPQLLEQLEKKCTENGIQVHWAETTAEASRICSGDYPEPSRYPRDQGQVDGVGGNAPQSCAGRTRD
jgi:L-lactate dehydrogenase complex protein LldF